jgi:hypothetical protein
LKDGAAMNVFLIRRWMTAFCMNAILLMFFFSALHFCCSAQGAHDLSGEWEVSGGSHFLSKTHLWITMQMAGPPKAVFYAAYDDPEPALVTSALLQGSVFIFSVGPLHISYRGTVSPNGDTIRGSCTVGNESRSLDFRRNIDTQSITVQTLEQMLAAVSGKSDAQVAVQLHGIRLTERLSSTRLGRLEAKMPRPEARQALIALADSAAFLNPPTDEIPAMENPDRTSQDKMLALAADYVARTISQLPNFTAIRTTSSYQRGLQFKELWHAVGLSHALVSYRDGQETQRLSLFGITPGLETGGEFGPILTIVMRDITKDNFAWSRWEHGNESLLAVFRYRADVDHSHYQVENRISGYVGEISIDPADGTIYRVVLRADMEPANPLLEADLLVEYGPEMLGGRSYICPIRGVALSQGLNLQLVNDVVFTNYHLFHVSTNILPGTKPVE